MEWTPENTALITTPTCIYVKHYKYLLIRLKLENREDVLNENDAAVK